MNKELERYRGKLKTQNVFYVVAAIVVIAFIVLGVTKVIVPAVGNPRWTEAWNGFITGLSTAVVLCMALGLVTNLRAMNNEERLKKLYIKEHDERAKAIAERAGDLSYWFETLGLVLGIIIGGYFNPMISFVCLGCLFYICFVRLGLKIYYNSKI